MPRSLTPDEQAAYKRFAELLRPEHQQAFVTQVQSAKIEFEDLEHTDFKYDASIPSFDTWYFRTALSAYYDDEDGAEVSMILHFISPGIMSWLERFRYDDVPIKNQWPTAAQIRFFERPR